MSAPDLSILTPREREVVDMIGRFDDTRMRQVRVEGRPCVCPDGYREGG